MIKVKRVSDPVEESDGHRILVDRLWPRGMRKEALVHEAWLRGVSPSNALRQWLAHDPVKWDEFRLRYWLELDDNHDDIGKLIAYAKAGFVTLLFGSKERRYNNAVALKEYLENHLQKDGQTIKETSITR